MQFIGLVSATVGYILKYLSIPNQSIYELMAKSGLVLAKMGKRATAAIIDHLVAAIIAAILAAFVGLFARPLITVAYVTTAFSYFIVFESRGGQTIGKKLADIKVVKEDGSPIDYKEATIRNVLRLCQVVFCKLDSKIGSGLGRNQLLRLQLRPLC
ncbi:RDD family protein [Candidatus Acetothermia bacterium]|nr:RDD family protein [Candidatus Acetothermia bacterium]